MLKVYYCEQCDRVFFLQREKDVSCRCCSEIMMKLPISYEEYTVLNEKERSQMIRQLLQ